MQISIAKVDENGRAVPNENHVYVCHPALTRCLNIITFWTGYLRLCSGNGRVR